MVSTMRPCRSVLEVPVSDVKHERGTLYGQFTLDQVRGLPAMERAEMHARIAENLMDDVKTGIYTITPHNVTAAHAHAAIASAWALIADRNT